MRCAPRAGRSRRRVGAGGSGAAKARAAAPGGADRRARRGARAARVRRRRAPDRRRAQRRRRQRAQLLCLVRRGDRQGLRRDCANRRRRARADRARAAWRRRRGGAVELPADHHGVEARAGAGDRQLGRAQAGRAVAVDGAGTGRAGGRGGRARWRAQRGPRVRPRCRRAARAPPRRRQDRVHRLGRDRPAVSRYAGESNGKAVSLELGGKSPQVVLADAADLDAAADAIGWGIFYNAGQTCHAGSRVVVAREAGRPARRKARRIRARVRARRPGGIGHQARRDDQRGAPRRGARHACSAQRPTAHRCSSAESGRTRSPVAPTCCRP